jgi:hypothetical protein
MIVLFNLCLRPLRPDGHSCRALERLSHCGWRRMHGRFQLIDSPLNVPFRRSKPVPHHLHSLIDRFLHLRDLFFWCQCVSPSIGWGTVPKSPLHIRGLVSPQGTDPLTVLVVTPNDRTTTETLWHRSGGDWGIKRAGRKQEARGMGQSARLNTAHPYARRHGGPGQAVLIGC